MRASLRIRRALVYTAPMRIASHLFAALTALAPMAPMAFMAGFPTIVHAASSSAIERAGANGPEIERAIASSPAEQRDSMQWLVEHMPDQDLRTLDAKFLLTHVVTHGNEDLFGTCARNFVFVDIFIAFFRTQNNHTDAIRNSGHRNKLLSNFEVPKFSKWSQSRNLKAQAQPKKGSNTLKINKCLTFLDQHFDRIRVLRKLYLHN